MPRIIASAYDFVTVEMTEEDVSTFKASWPCSGIPDDAGYVFQFDCRTGDLMDMEQSVPSPDDAGPAELALSQDASRYAADCGHLAPELAR